MSHEDQGFINELISDLKQQRDHLKVKIHLGSTELQEEFAKLEDQLFQLNHRFDPVKEAVDESAKEVWDSLKLLGGEIKNGFHRIGKSIFNDSVI